jgi:hypothetical protein
MTVKIMMMDNKVNCCRGPVYLPFMKFSFGGEVRKGRRMRIVIS